MPTQARFSAPRIIARTASRSASDVERTTVLRRLMRRNITLQRTAAMHHAQTSHAFFSSAQVRSRRVHFQSRNVVQLTGRTAAATKRRNAAMNLVNGFKNWRKYRETYNELSRLNQRELADLGINRADINQVARRAVGY
jgi:uncharacterized protein YjiS (DUF1127 family)